MKLQDLHTHSRFDDGRASLEQMVNAAVGRGLSAIGLSIHSPIDGEYDWTARPEDLPRFIREARRLKQAYCDQIEVFCGIEFDLCSKVELSGFDYVIGSLHSTAAPNGLFSVDNTAEIARKGIMRYFDGDADAAAEAYFSQYRAIAENPEVDIVGHFDLLTKFDERCGLYDAGSRRFRDAACAAMELLVKAGKIFELNSGAISRGYRTSPYPAEGLLRRLRELDGKILLSSDAHSAEGIGFFFKVMLEIAENCGFRSIFQLTKSGFYPISISEIEL